MKHLNKLLSLWVRNDSVNNGLPFICLSHEFTYADNGNGTHKGTCSYCGSTVTEDHTQVTVDPVACTIEVLFNASKASQRDNILRLLSVLLPCNMALSIGHMGTAHSHMARFTHDQLADYTHDQIKNELQFVNN